jgi:hypothetical protein
MLGLVGILVLGSRVVAAPSEPFAWSGSVQGYALSGVEPDGDPLYRVALQSRLVGVNMPPVKLIVSSYLENFHPDTTPVLPDLLNPKQEAQNLGGFLEGKVLLTDDAGNTLYLGSFLTEAFLNNTNHTLMTFYNKSSGYAGGGRIKGSFVFGKQANFVGQLTGTLKLSAAAIADLKAHQGQKMKPLKDIIDAVTVTPHYYGTRGVHSSSPALHTGFGSNGSTGTPGSSGGGRQISPLTIAAGIGAILSLLAAGWLYLVERRRKATATS